jgi:putative addiction module CopG family antidote
MAVELTSNQRAFVRRAVESGWFAGQDDAVREALALWEERERRRLEFRSTIDEARASLARGEGREITRESMRELSAEVQERGRAHTFDAEEWFRELTAWSESHSATPLLPDEAISRDSIYGARPVNGSSSRHQHPAAPLATPSSPRACCRAGAEVAARRQRNAVYHAAEHSGASYFFSGLRAK